MKSSYFKSLTILIITDRTDLDDQLSKQFVASKQFIGDNNIIGIESRDKLREELQGKPSGGIYLTTIQKFMEDTQLLTDRYNVICISDEAHPLRINLDMKVKVTDSIVSKTYGFAKCLHDSLPNATYFGFIGTPIDATIEVFGDIVRHPYTMTEAVKDEITVNIVYDGRAAKITLREDRLRESEEYYEKRVEEGSTVAGKDRALIVDYIGIKKNMNIALGKYTYFEKKELDDVRQAVTIVLDQLEVLDQMFHNFDAKDYYVGSPVEQLNCLNRAVKYVQMTQDLELWFMAAVREMKQAFNLCSSSEQLIGADIEKTRKLLDDAIQSDGIEELFESGKHIDIYIFSDEYMARIEKIKMPNTKIKVLQRLLSYAIDEFKKVKKLKVLNFPRE